jgi:hypothetical protein
MSEVSWASAIEAKLQTLALAELVAGRKREQDARVDRELPATVKPALRAAPGTNLELDCRRR